MDLLIFDLLDGASGKRVVVAGNASLLPRHPKTINFHGRMAGLSLEASCYGGSIRRLREGYANT